MTLSRQDGNASIIFLLVIIFASAVGYIGFMYGKDYYKIQDKKSIQSQVDQPNSNKSQETNWPNCPKQDLQSNTGFLETYTVKSGDSLLSIAKNELNNSSRVNEIVVLNKETYPHLSTEKPFIEIGWKLFLPPKNQITNGSIYTGAGNLSFGDYNGKKLWGVSYENGGLGSFTMPELDEFGGQYNLKEGDCIFVTYQGGDGVHKVLKITPQM